MKKTIFAIIFMMVVLCGQANAQNRVKNIAAAGETTIVTYDDGASKSFVKTSVDKLSEEQLDAILSDSLMAVDIRHRWYDGEYRHHWYLLIPGGGMWMVQQPAWQPEVGFGGGYQTCHFAVEALAFYSRNRLPETAEKEDSYSTLRAMLSGTWKAWQTDSRRSYLGFKAGVGLGYHKTDFDRFEAEYFSSNWGFSAEAMLLGQWGINKNIAVRVEGGGVLVPKVPHFEGQDLGNIGLALRIGFSFRIGNRW